MSDEVEAEGYWRDARADGIKLRSVKQAFKFGVLVGLEHGRNEVVVSEEKPPFSLLVGVLGNYMTVFSFIADYLDPRLESLLGKSGTMASMILSLCVTILYVTVAQLFFSNTVAVKFGVMVAMVCTVFFWSPPIILWGVRLIVGGVRSVLRDGWRFPVARRG